MTPHGNNLGKNKVLYLLRRSMTFVSLAVREPAHVYSHVRVICFRLARKVNNNQHRMYASRSCSRHIWNPVPS